MKQLTAGTARNALKLANPSQKLCYALAQYFGAMQPAPAIIGGTISPANKGIIVDLIKAMPDFWNDFAGYFIQHRNGYRFTVNLLADPGRLAGGNSLVDSLLELSVDPVQPMKASLIPSGDPILDTSTTTTIEQMIVENFLLLQADREANNVTVPNGINGLTFVPMTMECEKLFGAMTTWYIETINDANRYAGLSRIKLSGNILMKPAVATALNAQPEYISYSPINPYDCCGFAEYNTLAA